MVGQSRKKNLKFCWAEHCEPFNNPREFLELETIPRETRDTSCKIQTRFINASFRFYFFLRNLTIYLVRSVNTYLPWSR